MIKLIDGLPDNVVGLEAVGEIEASDYTTVLDPAVAAALKNNDSIRLLYVLGDEFDGYSAGAMWQDTKVGVSHWSKWERMAIVTDHGAYADGVKVFGWIIPGEIKVFSVADLEAAKVWAAG